MKMNKRLLIQTPQLLGTILLGTAAIALLQGCSSAEVMESYSNNQAMDLRDTDNDGVINARDICANTPLTSVVSITGCSQWQVQERSDDFTFEFDMDKDKVLPEHETVLADIAAYMNQHSDARILLVGDTSPEGTEEYNKALGQRRADAVTAALIADGVKPDAIVGFVYADAFPQTLLKVRKRRTIVRMLHEDEQPIEQWTIYTVENSYKEQ